MQKNKFGRIVNVSSNDGLSIFVPTSMDYDSSKAGVIALTKNLAMELAPYIRVDSVAPGWVNTDMNEGLPHDFLKEEKQRALLKRFADSEEIAKVILFLASEDSSFMTGSIVTADGGYK